MENKPKSETKIAEGFPGQKMIVISPDRIVRIKENDLCKNLYPTAIGYYPHASQHQRDRIEGCDQHILLYCVNGKGWIKLYDEEFAIASNMFFIIPENVPHSYGSSPKDPWSIYWVHFTGKTANILYSRYKSGVSFPTAIPYDSANINTFNHLFSLLESDLNTRETELLYIRLLHFLSAFIYVNQVPVQEEEDRIAGSIRYMKNNINKKITIRELSNLAKYSVSRYSELFRERTGYAPIRYFLQLKIQKSCQYLYFTKMYIKEICKEIGIDDQYYFSKMFKKQMGMSPIKYRKTHKV